MATFFYSGSVTGLAGAGEWWDSVVTWIRKLRCRQTDFAAVKYCIELLVLVLLSRNDAAEANDGWRDAAVRQVGI